MTVGLRLDVENQAVDFLREVRHCEVVLLHTLCPARIIGIVLGSSGLGRLSVTPAGDDNGTESGIRQSNSRSFL